MGQGFGTFSGSGGACDRVSHQCFGSQVLKMKTSLDGAFFILESFSLPTSLLTVYTLVLLLLVLIYQALL